MQSAGADYKSLKQQMDIEYNTSVHANREFKEGEKRTYRRGKRSEGKLNDRKNRHGDPIGHQGMCVPTFVYAVGCDLTRPSAGLVV